MWCVSIFNQKKKKKGKMNGQKAVESRRDEKLTEQK